jgi:hypothetical protein
MKMIWHPTNTIQLGAFVLDESPHVFVQFAFSCNIYGGNAVSGSKYDMIKQVVEAHDFLLVLCGLRALLPWAARLMALAHGYEHHARAGVCYRTLTGAV